MLTQTPATRHDVWRALHAATDQHDMPVPRYVKDTECIIASPLLVIRLDYIDEAMAWAEYLGISDKEEISQRPGMIGISFLGDWRSTGWRALVLADEQVVEAVAAALVVAT